MSKYLFTFVLIWLLSFQEAYCGSIPPERHLIKGGKKPRPVKNLPVIEIALGKALPLVGSKPVSFINPVVVNPVEDPKEKEKEKEPGDDPDSKIVLQLPGKPIEKGGTDFLSSEVLVDILFVDSIVSAAQKKGLSFKLGSTKDVEVTLLASILPELGERAEDEEIRLFCGHGKDTSKEDGTSKKISSIEDQSLVIGTVEEIDENIKDPIDSGGASSNCSLSIEEYSPNLSAYLDLFLKRYSSYTLIEDKDDLGARMQLALIRVAKMSTLLVEFEKGSIKK